jgi:multiple sugar transport system ATP-binding protein
MGRAIVRSPQVFLMDEPLSNLDAKLRVSTRTQIAALQTRLGVTTVYVTHDQVEAMTMGDRVAVMKDGILQQCDTPLTLYDAPRNLFVAGFIGSPAMNLIEGNVQQDGVHLGDYTVPVPRDTLGKAADEKNLVLGIRPENFRLSENPESGEGIPIDVGVVEELGADAFIYGTLSGIAEDELITAQQIVARIHGGKTPPHRGESVRLLVDETHVHVFSKESGDRISPATESVFTGPGPQPDHPRPGPTRGAERPH